MARCVYCKSDIGDERAVDVCDKCGVKVWGHKMFNAIKTGMAASREKGDLEQGHVS